MAKYHLNDKGNAGVCHAKISCPFGDLEENHWDSAEEARAAYSESQKVWDTLPTRPLTAADFNYGNVERSDFTGPIVAKFLEQTGVLSTLERVDKYTEDPDDRIIGRYPDRSAYLRADKLAEGHKTFSRSERAMTRLAASLLDNEVPLNLSHDMAALDMTNRSLFINALAEASEVRIASLPF